MRSTVANNTNGSLLRRTKSALPAGDSAPCAAGADRVARERAEWVLDRQNALGTVLDAHDTLVCPSSTVMDIQPVYSTVRGK